MDKLVKCVYEKCNRGCLNKNHHRAMYASITQRNFDEQKIIPKQSSKINYERLNEFLEEQLDKNISCQQKN